MPGRISLVRRSFGGVWRCPGRVLPPGRPVRLLESHFSAATRKAVASEGYGFRPESLLDDLALLAPAAVGVVLIVWNRRWDLLFPMVLLATALVIHLWHRPYRYYYGLHNC